MLLVYSSYFLIIVSVNPQPTGQLRTSFINELVYNNNEKELCKTGFSFLFYLEPVKKLCWLFSFPKLFV
ncbi:hypothetical protein COY27_00195 [Candidatus Woesearchaeota archaeon CG_4_10_14_0_2_um_filter_33_13]|nr:MAG: hypothetical protein COY27_00195 [Candidatus Woesearchaeota archaeon CG_4_10_14_0_2_um_filter_33_13]